MKTKPALFQVLNALGEIMWMRPDDLVALRAPKHRAKPARVLGASPKTGRVLVQGFTVHGEAYKRPRYVNGASVLGFWQ